jgi:hypothetical protein
MCYPFPKDWLENASQIPPTPLFAKGGEGGFFSRYSGTGFVGGQTAKEITFIKEGEK